MKFDKIHNKGQAQIFENKYLEMLTKGHPAIIWGMYIPILAYCIYYGVSSQGLSIKETVFLFFGAVLFWTLFEYFAHRYLFHWTGKQASLKRVVYIFHGNHHHYPRDKQRLFMPPIPSILLASIIFCIQYLILGNYVFAFFPGFMIGYLLYASMHYLIHAVAPPFKFKPSLTSLQK